MGVYSTLMFGPLVLKMFAWSVKPVITDSETVLKLFMGRPTTGSFFYIMVVALAR